jgi:hypothetical protein
MDFSRVAVTPATVTRYAVCLPLAIDPRQSRFATRAFAVHQLVAARNETYCGRGVLRADYADWTVEGHHEKQ